MVPPLKQKPCVLTLAMVASALMLQVAKGQTIVEVLSNQRATTLISLLQRANLVDAVAASTPLTLFAPTNRAFNKVPREVLAALNANPQLLRTVLLSHVVPGKAIFSSQLAEDQVVTSAGPNGERIRVNTYNSGWRGTKVTANGKLVNRADQNATDDRSVIHFVSEVLPTVSPQDSIASKLQADARFSTLVTVLQKTGLLGALSSQDGTLTVFAPTNSAFQKVNPDTLNSLLLDENEATLVQILQRHVVAGPPTLFRRGIRSGRYTTLGGEMIRAQAHGCRVYLIGGGGGQQSRVHFSGEEIAASNGVIHPIDGVL